MFKMEVCLLFDYGRGQFKGSGRENGHDFYIEDGWVRGIKPNFYWFRFQTGLLSTINIIQFIFKIGHQWHSFIIYSTRQFLVVKTKVIIINWCLIYLDGDMVTFTKVVAGHRASFTGQLMNNEMIQGVWCLSGYDQNGGQFTLTRQ